MKCPRKDCFAWNPNQINNCEALTDNFFGGKECPFYKNYKDKAEQEKELEERRNRYV